MSTPANEDRPESKMHDYRSYPSNSNKAKDSQDDISSRKVEKIVAGTIIRQKKSLGKRISENLRVVGTYVVFEIVIPAMKDTFADSMSQGVEKMLYGQPRSTSRRGPAISSRQGYVSYNRYAPGNLGRAEETRAQNRRRANHNFDNIILATRTEGEEVIERLFDLISRYDYATVKDFYTMVGADTSYTDEKWGWTDIRGAGVTRVTNGYLLELPTPEPLS